MVVIGLLCSSVVSSSHAAAGERRNTSSSVGVRSVSSRDPDSPPRQGDGDRADRRGAVRRPLTTSSPSPSTPLDARRGPSDALRGHLGVAADARAIDEVGADAPLELVGRALGDELAVRR